MTCKYKNELFANKIYVYTIKGDIIELPIGSTIIDYAYKLDTDIGNTMVSICKWWICACSLCFTQ